MLSQGDSTLAAGWLAKSSFDDCPMHLANARSFADFCLEMGIDNYTQWFPGKENAVADSLLRDFALDNNEVTRLIRDHCSPLVPQYFRIITLPETITSRIGSLLQKLPSTELLPSRPAPSAIAVGASMKFSSGALANSSTLFLEDSDDVKESKPLSALPPPSEKDRTPDELKQIALEPCPELFVPPSMVWLRPTGVTNLRVPSTTSADDFSTFWPSS